MAVAGTAKSAAPTTEALWASPEMPTPPSSAASSAATAPPSAEPVPPTVWVTNRTLRVRRWALAGDMLQEYPIRPARQPIHHRGQAGCILNTDPIARLER